MAQANRTQEEKKELIHNYISNNINYEGLDDFILDEVNKYIYKAFFNNLINKNIKLDEFNNDLEMIKQYIHQIYNCFIVLKHYDEFSITKKYYRLKNDNNRGELGLKKANKYLLNEVCPIYIKRELIELLSKYNFISFFGGIFGGYKSLDIVNFNNEEEDIFKNLCCDIINIKSQTFINIKNFFFNSIQ